MTPDLSYVLLVGREQEKGEYNKMDGGGKTRLFSSISVVYPVAFTVILTDKTYQIKYQTYYHFAVVRIFFSDCPLTRGEAALGSSLGLG